ncbi:MAG: extracellular solute-binding protein [Caldilineaceae bacterium]|nr:extracellular solute-binding protein [Caldilineaceae bacterium]
MPTRPRLPAIPFLNPAPNAPNTERELHVLLPQEGAVTAALHNRIDAWADQHELQVNLTSVTDYSRRLAERLQSETPPDLFVVTAFLFPELAESGVLSPAPVGSLDPAGIPPQLTAAFVWPPDSDPAIRYCLPREVRTLALVYDRVGLASAGLPPPTDWETLRAAAEAQTNVDLNRFGFIEAPDLSRWLPFFFGAGGTIIDKTGRMALHAQAADAAMEWYIRIFRDNFAGHAGESNNEWAGEVLAKGKGALTVEGNWVAPFFETHFPEFSYGVAPLPRGPAGVTRSVAFTSCYAVLAGSPFAQDSFDLAALLSSAAVVSELPNDGGWMPAGNALRDQWRKEFPHLAAFAAAVPGAHVWQFPSGFGPFLRSFNRGMVQLFAAEIEAASFLAEMQQTGEQLLLGAGDQ